MKRKNVIILMIDGGRFDHTLQSSTFNKLKNNSAFFAQSITYGPHTIAAMNAVFSGNPVESHKIISQQVGLVDVFPTIIELLGLKKLNSNINGTSLMPLFSEQQKIATILSNIDSQITSQTQYKEKLKRLKKSLMQKLLTGQVRVKV